MPAMIDEMRSDAVFVVRIMRVRFGGNLGHELLWKNQTDRPLSELSVSVEFMYRTDKWKFYL